MSRHIDRILTNAPIVIVPAKPNPYLVISYGHADRAEVKLSLSTPGQPAVTFPNITSLKLQHSNAQNPDPNDPGDWYPDTDFATKFASAGSIIAPTPFGFVVPSQGRTASILRFLSADNTTVFVTLTTSEDGA